MKYKSGSIGRAFVIKFDDKDDVLKSLEGLARDEGVKGGVIYMIGGMRKGKVVVGPVKDAMPPEPVWKQFDEPHEIVALGTVFEDANGPKVHLHGAFGRGDSVKVGCLREMSETFLLLEAVLLEITGIDARRELDPASNLILLKIH